MRILLAHTYYKQPGGEDRVFAAETALLRQNGHEVVHYCLHNDKTADFGGKRLLAQTLWSGAAYAELREMVHRIRPDVCHFHNTFPLMSPSVFYAAKAERVPVVATLHNYRLVCPGATLMRRDAVCESCLKARVPWHGVVHGCYRGSRGASAATALMLAAHRYAGTWSRAVDVWVALTPFAREKFIEGGLPANRLAVKPNFVAPDPGGSEQRENFALFVGRLAPEKGIETLLAAWRQLKAPMRLRIAGSGPLEDQVAQACRADERIEWLGRLSNAQTVEQMKKARVLVFPSIWYEGLPLTVLEAFATGLPVLASNLGAMSSLVENGANGLHFAPGSGTDLAAKIAWCWDNPRNVTRLGRQARQTYLAHYTAASNYEQLMQIYSRAIRSAQEGELLGQNNRTGDEQL